MKNTILLTGIILFSITVQAQLKRTPVCPAFSVDILKGRVNDLPISSNPAQIKAKFPCFTSSEADGSTTKCGGNVFFKDKDIYFYTDRDYIEIGQKFKGKLSIPLMGASRNGLFKWLGHPRIKDVNWDAFTTEYGILILYYNKANKVYKIQFSTEGTETIKLCE